MTRRSKRELEKAVEDLVENTHHEEPSSNLTDEEREDYRTVLRWRRQLSRDHGVHLDIESEVFAEIVGEVFAGNLVGAPQRGEVELDDVQAAAEAVGFEPEDYT